MRINLERTIDESYEIIIDINLFPQIAQDLEELELDSRYAIITDSNVKLLYVDALQQELQSKGLESHIFSFEAGESSKTRETKAEIEDQMFELGLGRDSFILALGGGVVGDLAGFVAATYARGVPYIQIPTTLLAQADSSIGGKTGVNTTNGKNLSGAFKQPWRVYIDVTTLGTLDDGEYRAGLSETIKHGMLDGKFFSYLEQNMDLILARNLDILLYIAEQNCRIKGNVVVQDPEEKGLRRQLNYGHTVGHALETLSGYNLLHGEAVSIGMMVAGRIAAELTNFSVNDLQRQEQLLKRAGLPTIIPEGITNEAIIGATYLDKKAKVGSARYVLPVAIGSMHDFSGVYATPVDNQIVTRALQATR